MPEVPEAVQEIRQERDAEYGRYVANDVIFLNGARAFNAGDAVPVSHIERGVVSLDEVTDLSKKTKKES